MDCFAPSSAARVLIDHPPFDPHDQALSYSQRGEWPCRWITCPGCSTPPCVAAFRRSFQLDRDATIRLHVSGDERYELFLDGRRIGWGSQRGNPGNWFFETYELHLAAGSHLLVARQWALGDLAPCAQLSLKPGFILAPDDVQYLDLLATGIAHWQTKRLGGYTVQDDPPRHLAGPSFIIDGIAIAWGFELGQGDDWQPAVATHKGLTATPFNRFSRRHQMRPSLLPAMIDRPAPPGTVRLVAAVDTAPVDKIAVRAADNITAEHRQWQALLATDQALSIPPHTRRRVIIDLQNYYCGYWQVATSGGRGAIVDLLWAEALYLYDDPSKGGYKADRSDVEGKYFRGCGDTFKPDGSAEPHLFEPLWWQAGRYLQLVITTADQALTIHHFALRETRYPIESEAVFHAGDPRLDRVVPIAVRSVQMCMHETYMDCPHYEQMMYAGDTRLQVLVTYCISHDDRMPRNALRVFDMSRQSDGLTQSRYPNRLMQIIPGFSLWWIGMLYDYALWRSDPAFVQQLLPGARCVIEGYLRTMNPGGLIENPAGWNYMDWVDGWPDGVPPSGDAGVSALINWQFALILTQLAELETAFGDAELVERYRRLARNLATRLHDRFWIDDRALFADDDSHQHYSEHTQCMALLSDLVDPACRDRLIDALRHDKTLARTTIYFSHYLFETLTRYNHVGDLLKHLDFWFELNRLNLKTTVEKHDPVRSDCHAWGAHPVYHYFASILGIRPAAFGFQTVDIRPQLGPLDSVSGKLAHPHGFIEADVRRRAGRLTGSITLPSHTTGLLHANGCDLPLGANATTTF